MKSTQVYLCSLGILILGALSCGPASSMPGAIDAAMTQCQPGVAIILVGDGYLENRCGCTETAGAIVVSPDTFICHLTSGTSQVQFYFPGVSLKHQIFSEGANSFLPSPLIDPQAMPRIWAHAVFLSKSRATYSFRDFITGMSGELITP